MAEVVDEVYYFKLGQLFFSLQQENETRNIAVKIILSFINTFYSNVFAKAMTSSICFKTEAFAVPPIELFLSTLTS